MQLADVKAPELFLAVALWYNFIGPQYMDQGFADKYPYLIPPAEDDLERFASLLQKVTSRNSGLWGGDRWGSRWTNDSKFRPDDAGRHGDHYTEFYINCHIQSTGRRYPFRNEMEDLYMRANNDLFLAVGRDSIKLETALENFGRIDSLLGEQYKKLFSGTHDYFGVIETASQVLKLEDSVFSIDRGSFPFALYDSFIIEAVMGSHLKELQFNQEDATRKYDVLENPNPYYRDQVAIDDAFWVFEGGKITYNAAIRKLDSLEEGTALARCFCNQREYNSTVVRSLAAHLSQ